MKPTDYKLLTELNQNDIALVCPIPIITTHNLITSNFERVDGIAKLEVDDQFSFYSNNNRLRIDLNNIVLLSNTNYNSKALREEVEASERRYEEYRKLSRSNSTGFSAFAGLSYSGYASDELRHELDLEGQLRREISEAAQIKGTIKISTEHIEPEKYFGEAPLQSIEMADTTIAMVSREDKVAGDRLSSILHYETTFYWEEFLGAIKQKVNITEKQAEKIVAAVGKYFVRDSYDIRLSDIQITPLNNRPEELLSKVCAWINTRDNIFQSGLERIVPSYKITFPESMRIKNERIELVEVGYRDVTWYEGFNAKPPLFIGVTPYIEFDETVFLGRKKRRSLQMNRRELSSRSMDLKGELPEGLMRLAQICFQALGDKARVGYNQ